jgi:hypothetical protein
MRVLAEAGKDLVTDELAIARNLVENGLRCRQKVQTADATVGGIGPAFDQSTGLQAVDQPADRDRLDFADGGHFVLGDARLAAEPTQDHPLSSGHAARPRTLVEPRPHHAGDVVQQYQWIAVEILHLKYL